MSRSLLIRAAPRPSKPEAPSSADGQPGHGDRDAAGVARVVNVRSGRRLEREVIPSGADRDLEMERRHEFANAPTPSLDALVVEDREGPRPCEARRLA